jgi:apolipoprotein N-acyltransferase
MVARLGSERLPWLSLGYAIVDSPLAGWAPLFGVYGVSWPRS